ncbi:ABC transporter substrate-binding protein [Roseobacter sp.]|uniref:ABC transporter substrate-binding protein n=1 Tax=Roseobacter sp. TaxID=1907202 RepID=UPI00385AE9F6
MKILKLNRPLLAALAASTALAGAATAEELTIGVRSGAESMDPHFSAIGINVSAMKNVYETLTARDDNLQLQPGLAESWEPVDDLTWHFKLREGVTFHDGSTLDAADVVQSINRIPLAAGPDGGLVTYTRRIVEASVVDDLTVALKTDSPAATLPLDLTRLFVIPSEIALDTPVSEFNSGAAAIGTGPYKLDSWAAKGDMVVVPNDAYWGDAAKWDKVTFSEISNDSARVAALLSDRVDLINYAPPTDVARLRSEDGLEVFSGSSVYIFMLFPDYRDETPLVRAKDGGALDSNPFQDLRVRQAISYGVNRDAIASRVMEDLATPASQIITEGFFGWSPEAGELSYDLDKAKALLAEAGYPDGFQVDLHCTSDRLPMDGDICAALGPMLARIGIDASVNATPRAVYFPAQSGREYSLMMNGWGSLTGEASYILSSMVHTKIEDGSYGVFNHFSYSNPEIDELVETALGTIDEGERKSLLEQAMKVTMDDLMAIPIVNLSAIWAGDSEKLTYLPRADEDTLAINALPTQ